VAVLVKPFRGAKHNRSHPLAKGLVETWLFNELGGKLLSDVCGYRTASLYGTSWVSGALRFSITSDEGTIQTSGPPILAGRPAFTMIARFRTDAVYQGAGRGLYSERESATPILKFDMLDGVSQHSALLTVRDASSHLLQVRSTVAIDDGEWHTVAMVLDGTVGYVYVDGVLDATDSNGSLDMTDYPTDVPITFGNDAYSGVADFLGDADFFFGYSRALSASEVVHLSAHPYAMFEAPKRAPLVYAVAGGTLITVSDAGLGADAVLVEVMVPVNDAGAGADSAVVEGEVDLQDSGAGSETVSVDVFIVVSDSGSGAENISVAGEGDVRIQDLGAGADDVILACSVALQDAGTGGDQVALEVTLPLLEDAGNGQDTLSVLASLAVADSGLGVDTVARGESGVVISDVALGADALTITAEVAVPDTGVALESLLVDTGVIAEIVRMLAIQLRQPSLGAVALSPPSMESVACAAPGLTDVVITT
jgi:hypothetical protein